MGGPITADFAREETDLIWIGVFFFIVGMLGAVFPKCYGIWWPKGLRPLRFFRVTGVLFALWGLGMIAASAWDLIANR